MSGKNGSEEIEQERGVADPEVVVRSKRRRFTGEYKTRILREADGCMRSGEIGALLRREGLYSSHLISWRGQRKQDGVSGLSRKRGRKPDTETKLAKKNAQLEKANRRLEEKLRQAQIIIEFQKKMSELWTANSNPDGSEEND